jgi:hypothetical protein
MVMTHKNSIKVCKTGPPRDKLSGTRHVVSGGDHSIAFTCEPTGLLNLAIQA